MRICIISDLNQFEGVGVYSQELYNRLKIKFDLDYIYLDFSGRRVVQDPNGANKILVELKRLPGEPKPLFWLRAKRYIPDYDLYHLASQNLSFLGKNLNFVLTVHDLIPLFTPGSLFQKSARKWLYSGIPFAKHVMTDSEYSKKDVLKLHRNVGNRTSVISLAASGNFRPVDSAESRKKLGLDPDTRYILHLGVDKWRKNVAGAIRALELLRSRLPDTKLIRVGRNSESTLRMIADLGLRDSVRSMQGISQEELVLLYNASDLLLFSSYYEGFGLPVLEAMACGLPVVCSNRTSLPEIAEGAAELVDPDNISQMANVMENVLTSQSIRQQLSNLGMTRAKEFSWNKTAEAVANVYRKFS